MADKLAKLSDEELEAAYLLLAEQANQVSMAQELVRAEQSRRRVIVDADKHASFDAVGQSSLDAAVQGAPAKADELAKQRQAREDEIKAVLDGLREEVRPDAVVLLDDLAAQTPLGVPLDPVLVAQLMARFSAPEVTPAPAEG